MAHAVAVLGPAFAALTSNLSPEAIILENNVATNDEVNAVVNTLNGTAGEDFEGASAASQGHALFAFAVAAANQGASSKTRFSGGFNLQNATPAFHRFITFGRIAQVIKMTPCDTSDTSLLSVRRFCRRYANLVYDHFRQTGTFPANVKPLWPTDRKLLSFDFASAINHPSALPLPGNRPPIVITDNHYITIDANSRALIVRAREQEKGQRVTNAHEYLNGQISIAST